MGRYREWRPAPRFVPLAPAGLVAVVVVLDPSYVLFENWFFYTYASACLLAMAAFAGVRFVRTRSLGWGIGFFAGLSVEETADADLETTAGKGGEAQ